MAAGGVRSGPLSVLVWPAEDFQKEKNPRRLPNVHILMLDTTCEDRGRCTVLCLSLDSRKKNKDAASELFFLHVKLGELPSY